MNPLSYSEYIDLVETLDRSTPVDESVVRTIVQQTLMAVGQNLALTPEQSAAFISYLKAGSSLEVWAQANRDLLLAASLSYPDLFASYLKYQRVLNSYTKG